jgi:hypothetical protein
MMHFTEQISAITERHPCQTSEGDEKSPVTTGGWKIHGFSVLTVKQVNTYELV